MTAQAPDRIFLEGELHPLFENPLESYWTPERPRPRFLAPHQANWRGYVATWAVVEERLVLCGIEGTVLTDAAGRPAVSTVPYLQQTPPPAGAPTADAALALLFPGAAETVAAVWYSGTLRIPRGARRRYVHLGYASVYEEEIRIRVEAGVIREREVIRTEDPLPPEPGPLYAP